MRAAGSVGRSRVVVCGNTVEDHLVRPVGNALGWGKTTLVEEILTTTGGNGANTSYTIANLGMPVTLLTLLGPERRVLQRLERAGVDTSRVEEVPLPTSVSIVLVHAGGHRAFLYQLGASAGTFRKPLSLPEDAAHFHLASVYRMPDLRTAAPGFLRTAKEAGLSTSVDTQWDTEGEWLAVLAPSLPYTDLLLVNEDEGRMLTECDDPREMALALRDAGARDVVVKLGPRGCFAMTSEGEFHSPAHEAIVVDTTGAGDCFTGGYLVARLRGGSHREAAEFANHIGARAVSALGATQGLE